MNKHNNIGLLHRRGFNLGNVQADQVGGTGLSTAELSISKLSISKPSISQPSIFKLQTDWAQGNAILLKSICSDQLVNHSDHIAQSRVLYDAILNGQECDQLLDQSPYLERLENDFESLGCSVNEGDDQEIETIIFDASKNGEVLAEDVWMKVSWLSFYEEDASLRFRFSFGIDHVEDVAADALRQHHAALLTEAVFPESRLVTHNQTLNSLLNKALESESINFVERIIYFNSPNGGAYLHHDRERGHAGVVYVQVTGSTFWVALPKQALIDEITTFVQQCTATNSWPGNVNQSMQTELVEYTNDQAMLSAELESFSNSTLIHLINETEAFVQQLVKNGHGHFLQAGDALLLPQETEMNCCWHSVFNLGDDTGQALSFAIRL